MQRDRVPDTDHISRYCGGAQILPDGRISGTAFRLRELEQYLSVNWLEYLGLGDRDSEIAEVRRVLVAKGRNLGTTARLAVLNAGVLREHVASASADHRVLDILHEPEPKDPSHAGIYGLRRDDTLMEIAELIAQAVQDTILRRSEPGCPREPHGCPSLRRQAWRAPARGDPFR